ncbi:lytic transglycosylase domain-containing protein [Rhizobium sp. RU20A]|uniref:lytic transglycosylase domain-containing protein n=1 Tax=Rhizobium sp. RU20A TaxID=1907412 RepID=UPI001FCE859E|nr:lytic transglycosylase domain-containing protein [Rhizobium sp. RU20A]
MTLALGTAVPSYALEPNALVPVPKLRPGNPVLGNGPAGDITGSIPRAQAQPDRQTRISPAPISPTASVLKSGLDALSNRKPLDAIAVRDSLPDGLDRHILTWAIAMSGQRGVPSRFIATAQRELSGWPGLQGLRALSEKALLAENGSPQDVLAAFGASQPETTEGTIALARANVAIGQPQQAARLIAGLWHREGFAKDREDAILSEFGSLLKADDHRRRMEMLLYRGRVDQAKRFSELGQAQSLYRAWTAVIRKAGNADQLIAAVDASWRNSPAYLFVRIENLRKKEDYAGAAALLATVPADRKGLTEPGEWWNEQRIVSRGLMDAGDMVGAYRVASRHVALRSTDIIDAEFHAGWYALRGLKDGKTAARHFAAMLPEASQPISIARANYWLGRAAEAGGPGDARAFFRKAAAYPTTFYGQLAAARIGEKQLNVAYPRPSEADRQRFAAREAVRAIDRLEAAGHGWRGDALYRALATQIDSPGELAILASRAETTRSHSLSLQIGKLAYGRGIDVAALAFPVGVIPPSANISAAGKALAYAIARQESAFDPAAISRADARGLLQILPGTARGVASRIGLAYSADKLTSDAGYNATLGAHYLGEQIADFGGSYILTFIAYNAGPRRVPQWINRYGDPRGRPIDEVVDWIERIPFGETRGYVQRVMENYQVYKARLGQPVDIVADLRHGR